MELLLKGGGEKLRLGKIGKKVILCVGILLVAGIFLKPEYKVIYQLGSTGGDYSRTLICAVAKHTWLPGQSERLALDLIKEHRRMNYDVPTNQITLEFYRSEKAFEKGESFKTYYFLIDGTEIELVPKLDWP